LVSDHSHGNTDDDALEKDISSPFLTDVPVIHSTRSNQSSPFPASKSADQQTIAEDDYYDADTMKTEKQRQQQPASKMKSKEK